MTRIYNILSATILIFCIASCTHGHDTEILLDKAQACLETNLDSAFVTLDSLDRKHLNTKELRARHALLYSIALEKVGIGMTNDSIINIAVDYYLDHDDKENAETALLWREKIRTNSELLSSMDSLQIQSARIINERYSDKMKLIANRKSMIMLSICSLFILGICLLIIRRVSRKLQMKPDDKAMELIRQRLGVLDMILASRISSDDKAWKISEEEIENLISDREEFLISTKVIFKESHPNFINYLQKKGLSDWEIGYCCLFTLGLKGKDVGEFLKKKRHYIISSEIRKKLGLDEHDTNIGIWLRNLLADLERKQM